MRSITFLLLGLIISLALALAGAAHPSPVTDPELFAWPCRIALVVAVFASGLAVERHVPRSSWWLIAMLLAVAMPATIALVAWLGTAAMGLSVGGAVLLGAVLAPTDPVLAGDVGLPGPHPDLGPVGEPRLSLHTEAGANDGLASPFVVAGVAIAAQGGTGWLGHWLVVGLGYRVGVAVALGLLAGRIGPAVIGRVGLPAGPAALVLAGALDAVTQLVHGYGLVAVFLAGIAFRRAEPDDAFHAGVHETGERVGHVLELAVLALIGAALTPDRLAIPGAAGWLLVAALLLIIRPVLAAAACLRTPLSRRQRAFLGWFGVRGVAAVYYVVMLAADHTLPATTTRTVVWTTLACVLASIVIHGASAVALSARWLAPPDSGG